MALTASARPLAILPSRRGPVSTFWLKLDLIVEGARRHARPFGITRFCFADTEQASLFHSHARDRVRACDAIEAIGNEVLVAWDDTDREATRHAVERLLRTAVPVGDVEIATVAFPDDGFTVPALLSSVHETVQELYLVDGHDRPLNGAQHTDDESRQAPTGERIHGHRPNEPRVAAHRLDETIDALAAGRAANGSTRPTRSQNGQPVPSARRRT